jgi:hypothetical protein
MSFPDRTHFETSDELCRYIAENTGDTCLLNFSAGKDSVGCWLQVRRYFKRVIPVYRYHVPGLKFVERSLAYYEDFFGTKIERIPDPFFMKRLDQLEFQAPRRVGQLNEAKFTREYEQEDIACWLREKYDAPWAYTASGRRAADSMRRLVTMRRFGVLRKESFSFYACFDWKENDLHRELVQAGVKLPVDYRHFGRSFESIRYPFCKVIRDEFPEDWETIQKWFPLAGAEIARREFYFKELADG